MLIFYLFVMMTVCKSQGWMITLLGIFVKGAGTKSTIYSIFLMVGLGNI